MFDMKNLTRLKKLDENAPDTMKAFWAFDKEAFKEGAIDVLHKQLMAVAVALTTQCPYCIELHVKAARQAGANDTMLTEAAIGAAAMRAGAAVTHASHCSKSNEGTAEAPQAVPLARSSTIKSSEQPLRWYFRVESC
ncbi:carboxymuconolactone decarboxylase family protein [Alloacidobacterium dinghuense]|uniref:Carboxymuconolactone decarboxylase family protein n=1 Tax=Alloacidobacterium dinghuense TaxID=2763107 RepID=A0A7G8BGJ7_9BACT|nr:carboxymuconolactone decarboxylase family protein [Alloacidobacterium dinghuense]QNI31667.1 carboxymuconolactone decarboxylase family protein [Alloacidobacterium dinghuense]